MACGVLVPMRTRAVLPPRFGGVLRMAVPERLSRLDPTLLSQDYEFAVAGCIFDTLLRPAAGGVEPVLLEAMPVVSGDGLTYYFKLREDVKFHDGSPLDTADVLETFKRLVAAKQSPYAWLLADVVGAADFRRNKARTIAGFKVSDAFRFEVKLARRQSDFLKYLCFPALSIASSQDNDFDRPIGTGRFKYSGRGSKGEITLVANEDYFRGRPYLDSITIRQIGDDRDRMTEFKRGELDVVDVPTNGLGRAEHDTFGPEIRSSMKRIYFLDINPDISALSTPELRAAVSKAADRDGIVKILLGGNGAVENNMPGSIKTAPLKKAAAKDEVFTLWYPERSQTMKLVAEKLALNFQQAGLSVALEPRSPAGMSQYTRDTAPAFELRSMPAILGLQQSIDEPLFNPDFTSHSSAMARRLDPKFDRRSRGVLGTAVVLFSVRPAYICRVYVHGLSVSPLGTPDLSSVFFREPFESKEVDSDRKKDKQKEPETRTKQNIGEKGKVKN
jgi:ABC-type transport system substrate-binding protein